MKIAISGTYSTGKTTLTEALSIATQVPRTQARTMREILPDAVPGKTLEQCNPAELLNLGLSRLSERVVNEERCGDKFFSDGSCLHEWVYGAARLETGINPNDGDLVLAIKLLWGNLIYLFIVVILMHLEMSLNVMLRRRIQNLSICPLNLIW
ncbi:ATP-binding protein [Vibrio cholerae]|uniref:ATP-binding protein n=1 Tax=Vibrio cholerae TaxID=666 RepID=UPI0021B28E1B|nr:ATP-binding protein [Vibrio cholerae]